MNDPERGTRRSLLPHEAAVPAGLWAVALVLGLTFLSESRDNPFFANQISDSVYFLRWSADMAQGRGFGPQPYFVNPLYLYFLAALHKVWIATVPSIRLVQLFLGSLIYPLIYLVGNRLFGRASGLAGALVALSYGPLLEVSSEVVGTWLEILLVLLAVLVLTRGSRWPALVLGGAVCGLAALARPNMLLFVAAAAVTMVLPWGELVGQGWRSRALRTAAFLGAAAAVIVPVTLRNLVKGGDLVLISSHGGINFYIGNSPQARGTFYAPPGFHEDLVSVNSLDARRLAEGATGRRLSPREVSSFWFGKGMDFLWHNPWKASRLYARKLLLSAHSHEVSLNSDYQLLREESRVLQVLGLPFAFLLVGGLIGLGLSCSRRELIYFQLMTAVCLLTPVLFFVSSRYRLPAAALLTIPAGHGLARAWASVGKDPRRVLIGMAAMASAALLLSYPYPLIQDLRGDSLASSYESLGIHMYESGRVDEAEKALRRAVEERPAIQSPHWYLARILEGRGDLAGAQVQWSLAARYYGSNNSWGREAARNRDRIGALRKGNERMGKGAD